MLRLLTAGESHGPQITAILDGVPAGLRLDETIIARGMRRRQLGYGRGNRQKIERDEAHFVSGLRYGMTTGAPLTLVVANRDHKNWQAVLAPYGEAPEEGQRELTRPRPGHADLVGMLKYGHEDARNILERASARETAARVAAGEVARAMLGAIGVEVFSHVLSIGSAAVDPSSLSRLSLDELAHTAESNDLRCANAYEAMKAEIDGAAADGDTVGGIFEVVARGLPVGLGSSMAPDRKIDARLAFAMLSIPAVKGCEIGPAFENAGLRGSAVHDEFHPVDGELPKRSSNRAGGLEGGMTTGEPLLCRGALKPISTLKKALASLDMATNVAQKAAFERSDVCAVPAAGVIGEAVLMLVLADALLESFSSDTMEDLVESVRRRDDSFRARMGGLSA